ncbi:hypothetical protein K443DRAFT_8151 [Laccaria amethystina LaAM-08-1]|uniref:Uncharacterized protein n=1 Tax=Laccaria amethystina LaAM-08-1 TaxID=1095629 RepID=A0A0C9XQ31_9AGAR|nr:hypothetical protein K443DRAFT_8151 [Laccaria amethystina LaAM-08-1]
MTNDNGWEVREEVQQWVNEHWPYRRNATMTMWHVTEPRCHVADSNVETKHRTSISIVIRRYCLYNNAKVSTLYPTFVSTPLPNKVPPNEWDPQRPRYPHTTRTPARREHPHTMKIPPCKENTPMQGEHPRATSPSLHDEDTPT